MKLAILDTNILISATFWKGDSYRLFQQIEKGKLRVVTSPDLLSEYREVLTRADIIEKMAEKDLNFSKAIALLIKQFTLVYPQNTPSVVEADPSDNMLLACVDASGADFIITNDKHLLTLQRYKNAIICTPGEFLEHHCQSDQ
ncbi:MAG: putative toxin-antitoxin system toxin component, PIN family [Nanoarchaeota archaeon]